MRIAASFAALAVATAAAADPPPARPTDIQNPAWAAAPSPADLGRLIPEAAVRAHVTGHVVLDCVVSVKGAAEDCQVTEETPPGYGFGDAAIKFSHSFRMIPMRRDGVPVGGAEITVPVTFALR